jgi:hypothetical protein
MSSLMDYLDAHANLVYLLLGLWLLAFFAMWSLGTYRKRRRSHRHILPGHTNAVEKTDEIWLDKLK